MTNRDQVQMARQQLEDQVRIMPMLYNRYQTTVGKVVFGDLVTAVQALTTYSSTYVTALGLQWTAIVDVANLLQTGDLFQMGPNEDVFPVPDLEDMLRPCWPRRQQACCPPATACQAMASGANDGQPARAADTTGPNPPAALTGPEDKRRWCELLDARPALVPSLRKRVCHAKTRLRAPGDCHPALAEQRVSLRPDSGEPAAPHAADSSAASGELRPWVSTPPGGPFPAGPEPVPSIEHDPILEDPAARPGFMASANSRSSARNYSNHIFGFATLRNGPTVQVQPEGAISSRPSPFASSWATRWRTDRANSSRLFASYPPRERTALSGRANTWRSGALLTWIASISATRPSSSPWGRTGT